MQKRPKILITNDDGIHAPGIHALWSAICNFADLYIIAPSSEKSCTGLGLTVRDPLQIHSIPWKKEAKAWHVSGTPGDCVRLALSVVLDFKPDLIVSGINKGSNAGRTVLYSGTLGAAIEGTFRHIPSIAFSCVNFDNPNYALTQPFIEPLVRYCLEHQLPAGTLLNVNFPDTPTIQGVRFAKQRKGYWIEDPEQRAHPEGHHYYWMGGKWHHQEEEEDSDVHLLSNGYVAAVPIHVAELTDLLHFEERKDLFDAKLEAFHQELSNKKSPFLFS